MNSVLLKNTLSDFVVPLFKQQKPKRFKYIPRNDKNSEETKEEHLKSQWKSVRGRGKHTGKSRSMPILLFILGMIIVIWYLLTHYETT